MSLPTAFITSMVFGVRRWDWLTQMLAHVVCCVYWFNPLVWYAAQRMRIEREQACDDLVLASGAKASDVFLNGLYPLRSDGTLGLALSYAFWGSFAAPIESNSGSP